MSVSVSANWQPEQGRGAAGRRNTSIESHGGSARGSISLVTGAQLSERLNDLINIEVQFPDTRKTLKTQFEGYDSQFRDANARISSVENGAAQGREGLKTDIEAVKGEIETAKTDIKKAITDSQNTMMEELAKQITTLIDGKFANLESQLADLTKRVEILEKDSAS